MLFSSFNASAVLSFLGIRALCLDASTRFSGTEFVNQTPPRARERQIARVNGLGSRAVSVMLPGAVRRRTYAHALRPSIRPVAESIQPRLAHGCPNRPRSTFLLVIMALILASQPAHIGTSRAG